ncbi:AbrB/MazE/SpoVT family DNA-binding domain-containing protein [bacterium]|nr:AbrB/MazE/SpoVT family DNA-binding domain-containing protein [bacterium]
MTTTISTSKGQIVIPSKIRRKWNIKNGTKFYIEERDNEIILKPLTTEYIKKMAGMLETKGKLSKILLEERAKDKNKEG